MSLALYKGKTIGQNRIAGAGFAYGNSNEMPFIKQFF
jgi:hypothetical protein